MIIPNRYYDIEKYDKEFLSFLEGKDYEELYINTLVEKEYIKKLGYLESFPNYLYSAYAIKPDHYEQVTHKVDVDKADLEEEGRFLIHAGCMEVYPYYAANRQGKNMIFSLRSKAFRHEDETNEARLNEFTIREFVFVGTPEFVEENMEYFQQKSLEFANRIGFGAHLESASDVFFPTKKNLIMSKLQKKNSKKVELAVNYYDKTLALGSFNYHRDHFSKMFGFDADGTQSACLGYGIERWIAKEHEIKEKGLK